MKISVTELGKQLGEVREFSFTEEFETIEMQGMEIKPVEPLQVDVKVTSLKNDYLVDMKYKTAISVPCSRCLKPVEIFVEGDFQKEYPKKGPDAVGEYIDLSEEIFTSLILQIPMQPLCSSECKGLCSICGQDLNEGECGCDRQVIDPRLAELKKFFEKNEVGD